MSKLTYKEFKKSLPSNRRNMVNEEVFNTIKKIIDDPEIDISDELISYSGVLQEGRFKVTDYAKACKYVAFKNMGMSNIDAYDRAFPGKITKWLEDGKNIDRIHQYIHRYNNSKLVVEITKRVVIPTKILNQDKVQKAINVLSELMLDAKSEMVRMKSAEALIRELKIDDDNKLELDITVKKDESLEQLEQTLAKFAEVQYNAIKENKSTPKQIAEMAIIEANIEQ